MKNVLLVAVGGALGSVLRYGIALWLKPVPSTGFPFATFLVNLFGSFGIGVLAGMAAKGGWTSNDGWPLLAIGLCGGFTTFSAFSLEGLRMLQSGNAIPAFLYLGGSVILSLLLCALGMRIAA